MPNTNNLIEVTKQCPWCSKLSTVTVDSEQYRKYDGTQPIQVAFPDLSNDDREILLTGICCECWDTLKGPDED